MSRVVVWPTEQPYDAGMADKRPDGVPDWLPAACAQGHPWIPGQVTTVVRSYVVCHCQGSGDTGHPPGHEIWVCTTMPCDAPPAYPPEHLANC